MNGTFFSISHNRILGTLALTALVAALAAYAYFTLKQAEYLYSGPTTISVMGEGEVLKKPDIAEFSFAVVTRGADVVAAQSESATKADDIINHLKEQGVADADLKTEQYSLSPYYRYEQRPCVLGQVCPPSEPVQDGFEVNQTVRVKVRDLAKAGSLIAAAGERGATNVSGLSFTIDNEDESKAEARALAIADAQEKARVLADDLGVRIGRMVGYYEEANGGYPMPYGKGGDAMERSAVAPAAPPLPVGENSVMSRVTISYQVH